MKKCSILYALSFISYTACLFAVEYITAQTWADMIFLAFLLCCVYELAYIFYYRKKDNVSFGRAVARLFQYSLIALWLWIAIYFVWGFFFGNNISNGFFGGDYTTYYGIEAWTEDDWGRLIFWIITIPTAVYNFVYYVVSKRLK